MENFEEKLDIPSSGVISETLNLSYTGGFIEANPEATYSFSVPVITDECPGSLNYMPLNKLSKEALEGTISEQEFLVDLQGKKFCVIICKEFERNDLILGSKTSLAKAADDFLFLAAVWDATEDPLMAATLLSCTFLSQKTDIATQERKPCFLKKEQVKWWLDPTISVSEKLKALAGQ